MPQDILLDQNYDLQVADGDLVVGESTYQHQAVLLLSEKGDFKESPLVGVGSKRYLENERPDEYAREIRQQFMADGMKVDRIQINEDLKVEIQADYGQD